MKLIRDKEQWIKYTGQKLVRGDVVKCRAVFDGDKYKQTWCDILKPITKGFYKGAYKAALIGCDPEVILIKDMITHVRKERCL